MNVTTYVLVPYLVKVDPQFGRVNNEHDGYEEEDAIGLFNELASELHIQDPMEEVDRPVPVFDEDDDIYSNDESQIIEIEEVLTIQMKNQTILSLPSQI